MTSGQKNLLAGLANLSDQNELSTPVPPGYKLGQCKYVVVLGTVISGLGKGIFSSSLAKLLQDKGFKVAPIKLEGYLNIDSGTLNPYRHGEVFVLDDGMECDMDLGTYERMLDQDLSRENFCTSGQIFTTVLEKERSGGYQGRDVQMIPHVTGEVKMRLRNLALASKAEVIFVEIGGTVGDYENAYFIEGVRELALEEGPGSVCFVALTYIVAPETLGEQKSKAAQLGLRSMMGMGIQPQIIACRAGSEVTDQVRQKISLYANVPMERVFSMHDRQSVYFVPDMLRDARIDQAVLKLLNIQDKVDSPCQQRAGKIWAQFTDRIAQDRKKVSIAITGKYTTVRDSYASIIKALEGAGTALGIDPQIKWIDTSDLTDENVAQGLADVQGIIVPGGFGTRGTEGKIACVKHARENKLPYLGLCYGFQMAVIEFARNVCGIDGANSTEIVPGCAQGVIDLLPEQYQITEMGGTMRLGGHDVKLLANSKAWEIFGKVDSVRLRFRHRYEVHPDYVAKLTAGGLVFSGKAPDRPIYQILELPDHPFFLGTQAHPEFTARPLRPQPLFVGFLQAAANRTGKSACNPCQKAARPADTAQSCSIGQDK